jgi:hypothetical protein
MDRRTQNSSLPLSQALMRTIRLASNPDGARLRTDIGVKRYRETGLETVSEPAGIDWAFGPQGGCWQITQAAGLGR